MIKKSIKLLISKFAHNAYTLQEFKISDILDSVENISISMSWTLNPNIHFCSNGSAIAAVFAQSWGPVELNISPWDSSKGLRNLGWVSGGGQWSQTNCQRYLTFKGSKLFWLVPIDAGKWVGDWFPFGEYVFFWIFLIFILSLWNCYWRLAFHFNLKGN